MRTVFTQGNGKNSVILLTGQGEGALAETVFKKVIEVLPTADIALSVFEASDWDGAFSPWPGRMANGRSFAGEGETTLRKIKAMLLPGYARVYIAGYSLAGLFSLWAVRETELFDGCACCSGSLWFAGWEEYAAAHPLKKPGLVYLSLGGKEEKAPDPVIAAIGEKTRREDKRLEGDPLVKKHTLVMNPGGHFASPEKRLAQGIVWLLRENADM